MLRIDQVLHQRYRIVRQLGHGGMGAVYEAIDERFGEPIALKEVVFASSNERQNDLVIKAFEREAKALAKAQHEAIPYVRDYFCELNRQFLVMELVEGEDLAELLAKRQDPFPLADGLKWFDQLLDALDYLHTLERPIIHRDIKPQNLKLNRRGKIKLLDFGIAKSSESAAATLSDQTFVGATLDYSPIEQILRAIDPTFREYILLKHKAKAEKVLGQTTDTRCDIYALGSTFYHLLTNRPPPDAVKRTLEVWEDRTDPLANPSVINPLIPQSVSACLIKAMAIERENRFDSAAAMQTALQGAIAGDRTLESSVYNESWKAEQLRLRIAEESRRREQELMQAKTEVLIAKDLPATPAENENTSDIQSLPTERMIVPPSSAGFHNEVHDDELSPAPFLNTIPSGSFSGKEVTETLRGTDTADHIQKTDRYNVNDAAELKPAGKKRSGVIWLLAAVLGVFGIGGIGGTIWMLGPDARGTGEAAGNINSNLSLTPSPEVSPSARPSETHPAAKPTLPVAEPTVNATPRQAPVSTPIITLPAKTPRPTPVRTPVKDKPPPKTPDPNCVYNNTCK